MGYAFNELIAPAVLLANPGISRDEFIRLLDQTHSSYNYEYGINDPMDYYIQDSEDKSFHRGIKGLAEILGLGESLEYIQFQRHKKDENGISINPPCMLPAREGKDYQFEVTVHKRNVLERPKIISGSSFDQLIVGDIWKGTYGDSNSGIVTKILKERHHKIKRKTSDDENEVNQDTEWTYRIKIRPFQPVYHEERFVSDKELYAKWPQFHPGFVYDWSKEKGYFFVGTFGGENFLWKQTQNKYYLDKLTFDLLPASFDSSGKLGYCDLVLTKEAIKYNAWKILSRKGLRHFQNFFKQFPEARQSYEKAVWDSHTSLSAKQQGMTVSEFLRYRMLKP